MAWRKKSIGQQQHFTKALQFKGTTVKIKFLALVQTARYFLLYEIHFMGFPKAPQECLGIAEVWAFQKLDWKCGGRVEGRQDVPGS